jgi:hypothetical protein
MTQALQEWRSCRGRCRIDTCQPLDEACLGHPTCSTEQVVRQKPDHLKGVCWRYGVKTGSNGECNQQRTGLKSIFTGVSAAGHVKIKAFDGNESGFVEREGPQVEGGEAPQIRRSLAT